MAEAGGDATVQYNKMELRHPFDLRPTAGNQMYVIDGIITAKDPAAFHIGMLLILFGADAHSTWIALLADLLGDDVH